MNATGLVHHRKRRALARTLTAFEDRVLPSLKRDLSPQEKRAIESYKQTIRDEFESLATDACDFLTFNGDVNGAALDLRDRVSPGGRPSRPASTRS